MKLTDHAKQRWAERFSNLCPDHEFSKAKKPKKRDMINIKKQCPQHVSIMKHKSNYGLDYKITPNGVVFVCNEDEIVITVFPYKYAQRAGRIDEKSVYIKGKYVKRAHAKNRW